VRLPYGKAKPFRKAGGGAAIIANFTGSRRDKRGTGAGLTLAAQERVLFSEFGPHPIALAFVLEKNIRG
jgi:hypothetical protein